MRKLHILLISAVFLIAWVLLGPIALAVPLFLCIKAYRSGSFTSKITLNQIVAWVVSTSLLAILCFFLWSDTFQFRTLIHHLMEWRIVETGASRAVFLKEDALLYPITVEMMTGLSLTLLIAVQCSQRSNFFHAVNEHLDLQIVTYGASRGGIRGLSVFTFLFSLAVLYSVPLQSIRYLMLSALYPVFAILLLLLGATIFLTAREMYVRRS